MFNLAFYQDRAGCKMFCCDLSIFRHFVSIFKYHNQGKPTNPMTPRQSDCMIALCSTVKSETRTGTVEKALTKRSALRRDPCQRKAHLITTAQGLPALRWQNKPTVPKNNSNTQFKGHNILSSGRWPARPASWRLRGAPNLKHFVITDVRNRPCEAWHWTVD